MLQSKDRSVYWFSQPKSNEICQLLGILTKEVFMIRRQLEIIKKMYELKNDTELAELLGVTKAYVSKMNKTETASTDMNLIMDDLIGLGYNDIQHIGNYIGKEKMIGLRKRQFFILTRNVEEKGQILWQEFMEEIDTEEVFKGEKSSLARREKER